MMSGVDRAATDDKQLDPAQDAVFPHDSSVDKQDEKARADPRSRRISFAPDRFSEDLSPISLDEIAKRLNANLTGIECGHQKFECANLTSTVLLLTLKVIDIWLSI
jgi:hypothetical protein